jgi:hypothetical protein
MFVSMLCFVQPRLINRTEKKKKKKKEKVFVVFVVVALFALCCTATVLLVDDFNVVDGDLKGATPRIGFTWIEKDEDSNSIAAASQTFLQVVDGHVKTTHVNTRRRT